MKRRTLGLLFIASALLVAVGLGSLRIPTLWRLCEFGEATSGRVIAAKPNDHNQVTYEYFVNGARYVSKGRDRRGVGELGSAVDVTFMKDNPTISQIGDVRADLRNEIASVGTAALLLPFFLMLRILYRNRRARAAP